jgi:predicted ester cyclase
MTVDRKVIARRAVLSAPIVLAAASSLPAAGAVRTSRDLLKAFLDTLSAHDLKALRALYVDSSYVQHQTLVTNAPTAISGPEAAVAYFQKRIEAFPDLTVTSDVSLFEGDMIAANLIWSGTHRGEYLGVPGTGRHVTFNSTDIMKVRGGLFSEHWGAADLFGLVSQLRS